MNMLLNKIVKSKKQETKEKYREQLREKMDNAINDRVWGTQSTEGNSEEIKCCYLTTKEDGH